MKPVAQKTLLATAALTLALAVGGAPASVLAQDAPAQVELLGPSPEEWHPFSRSTVRIYMADVKSQVVEGDVTRLMIAKPPMEGAAGDYSHSQEVVEFKCAAKQSRTLAEIEFGPDGAQTERYDDPSSWEPYTETMRDGFLSGIVCDHERSSVNWPSIRAWVDAGRK